MEDCRIAESIKENPNTGIALLAEKYGQLINYIIRGILAGYEQDMEECFQDTLMRCTDCIDYYDKSYKSMQGWICTIARRIAIDRLRKIKQGQIIYEQSVDDIENISAYESMEEEYIKKEKYQNVYDAINKLSKRDREIFLRKYFYMQTAEQIALEMGKSVRSVESHLYRIRKKLQDNLKEAKEGMSDEF